MKKIGIITFHRTTNFGSVLQTYGLYRKIELLGEKPEIIDYRCKAIEEREQLKNKLVFTPREIVKRILFFPVVKKKGEQLSAFLQEKTNFSTTVDSSNINQISKQYDKVFVGSDIVWGRDITEHDYNYFLKFVADDYKKYAYASSVGDYKQYDDDDDIGELLGKFNKIAVREDEAQKWVTDISGKDSELVCDPTMLLTADEWERETHPQKYNENYVLVYFDSPQNKCLNDAITYAKSRGLSVFYINYGLKIKGTKSVKPTTISEFLGLIKYANTIFTASYHGMLFSLYFNKNFYFYTRAHSSRVISLAKTVGVYDRLGDNSITETEIDYVVVNKKMEDFRNNSIAILGEMLRE